MGLDRMSYPEFEAGEREKKHMKLGRRWCLVLAASLAAQSDMGNLILSMTAAHQR